MKKFLSLALALVMTMSLVTISAGATFTDDSSINYSEAVDVMTAMEIVGGYANGSFDPDATLTRGAAAKIICNLLLGPTVASALGTTAAPFPDVAANHTFAGYIAYCANQGIISGYADGSFRPAGTITGYAFMKMLLGALGYDASIEGYTGTNWSVNVAADAKIAGLDNGNDDYLGSAAMTREEACLYALNALKSDMVKYSSKGFEIDGITVGASDAATIAFAGSEYVINGANDGILQFCELNFPKLKLDDSTVSDAFGRPAVEWKYDGDSVGIFVDSAADLVETFEGKVTQEEMYDVVENGTVAYYVDSKTAAATPALAETSTSAYGNTAVGTVTQVYKTAATTFSVVTINSYLVKAAADYDAKDEILKVDEVSAGLTLSEDKLSSDDFAVTEFEKGDYILVTVADDKVQSLAAAETVTGEADAFTVNKTVTLDGTKYDYSATAPTATKTFDYGFKGEQYLLVLDDQGNVLFTEGVEGSASTDYVFVDVFDESGTTGSKEKTWYATGYFADGTTAVMTLDKVFGESITGGDTLTNDASSDSDYSLTLNVGGPAVDKTWYAYSENEDGTYNLLAAENADGDAIFTTSGSAMTGDTVLFDGTLKANNDTIFVVYDSDKDLTTYTGIKNAPTVTGGTVDTYALMDDGFAVVVFVNAFASTNISGTTDSVSDYVYVLDAPSISKTSNGVEDTYKAIINGEVGEFTTLDDAASDRAAGLYGDLVTDGNYNDVADSAIAADVTNEVNYDTNVTVNGISYGGGVLDMGAHQYSVTDDTAIWVIDGTDAELVDAADLKDYLAKEELKGNATIYALYEKSELVTMYIVAADSYTIAAPANVDGVVSYSVDNKNAGTGDTVILTITTGTGAGTLTLTGATVTQLDDTAIAGGNLTIVASTTYQVKFVMGAANVTLTGSIA